MCGRGQRTDQDGVLEHTTVSVSELSTLTQVKRKRKVTHALRSVKATVGQNNRQ